MSGPKHSRGPWKACRNGECSCGHIWAEGDKRIATVHGATTDSDGTTYAEWTAEERKANAKLIAAAPRLAEELSDLAKHLEEHDPQGDVKAWLRALLDYHLPQARAALREAGE